MDVIHMRGKVAVVADAVLAKTPLPDPALLMTPAGVRTTLIGRKASGEDRLDQAPPRRKVVAGGRQRPDTVEMIGQDYPGIDGKGADSVHGLHGTPQKIDMPWQQVVATPLQEIDREEEAPSENAVATVVGNRVFAPFRYLDPRDRAYH